jgi:hypothetical protein
MSTYTMCADRVAHEARWLWEPVKRGQRVIGRQYICPVCPAAWRVTTGESW